MISRSNSHPIEIANPRSNSFGRKLRDLATIAIIGSAALGGVVVSCGVSRGQKFKDTPGFDNKHQFGRTVNSLSAMLAGVIAQQIYGSAEFDLLIEKPWYADARVKGKTSATSIESKVNLTFTSAVFHAAGDSGKQKGDVEKSEFNWGIKQTGPTTWEVSRLGLKLDTTLKVLVKNGVIEGEYIRPWGQDWKISGSYDQQGNLDLEVSPAWDEPNFKITGRIKKL